MKIKNIVITTILLTAGFQASASSTAFTESSFEQAIKSGGPVVVAFHSDSCGSCKIQKPNLEAVLSEDPLKPVPGFMANFEDTSEFRKKMQKPVRGPSTILVFNHGKEVSRIQGETNKEKIRATISKSITQN